MKEPPKEIDGCPVFLGEQQDDGDSGRLTNWFYVFPVATDDEDGRVWEWNQRTGEIRAVQEKL